MKDTNPEIFEQIKSHSNKKKFENLEKSYINWLENDNIEPFEKLKIIEEFDMEFEFGEKISKDFSNKIISGILDLHDNDDEISQIVCLLDEIMNLQSTDHKIFQLEFAKNLLKISELILKDFSFIVYSQKTTKVIFLIFNFFSFQKYTKNYVSSCTYMILCPN